MINCAVTIILLICYICLFILEQTQYALKITLYVTKKIPMMKPFRIFRFLSLAFLANLVLLACQIEDPFDPWTPSTPPETPSSPSQTKYTLKVSPNGTVKFPAEGGSITFSVSTNANRFGCSFPKNDWLSLVLTENNDGIIATVAPNKTGVERAFNLTFYGRLKGADDNEVEEVVKAVQPAQGSSGGGSGESVSSNGGTITCEDLSISFPEGTFTSTKNVTVVKAGNGMFKVSMPVSTQKPITVSVQCDEKNDNVHFVMNSTYLGRSTGKKTEEDFILETKYANGSYTTTLPAFKNEDADTQDSYKIGLALVNETKSSAWPSLPAGRDVQSGSVGGIKWKLYIREGADKSEYYNALNPAATEKMAGWIKEALTIITDQGYDIEDKERVIPYYYDDSSKDVFGYFEQNVWSDALSYIGLSAKNISADFDNVTDIKSMVLHETFHYFQADYDPRDSRHKGNIYSITDDENILYEMGAVWMEQFVRNGSLDANFLKNDVFDSNTIFLQGDLLGMGMEEERWITKGGKANKNDAYMEQGYTMAPMLYYFTTELNSFGFNRSGVRELHLLWNAKWRSGYTSYQILEEWVKVMHNCLFFNGAAYIDDYYIDLWKGKVVDGLSIHEILKATKTLKKEFNDKADTPDKYNFDQKVYPFGCAVRRVDLTGFKGVSMTNKDLIVKQEGSGVHTYVLMTDYNSSFKKFQHVQRNGEIFPTVKGDSIVLKGSTLESLRLKSGDHANEFYHELFLVTTNLDNKLHSTTVNSSKLSIELRSDDFNPQRISLLCEFQNGNGQHGRISMWGEKGNNEGAQFSVTRSGSDYKVTMNRTREEDNEKEECSFTLKSTGKNQYVVKDLNYKFTSSWYWDETTTAYSNSTLSIDEMAQVNYLSSTAWWEANNNSIISYSKDSNVTSNMSYSKSKGQSIGSNTFRVQLNF